MNGDGDGQSRTEEDFASGRFPDIGSADRDVAARGAKVDGIGDEGAVGTAERAERPFLAGNVSKGRDGGGIDKGRSEKGEVGRKWVRYEDQPRGATGSGEVQPARECRGDCRQHAGPGAGREYEKEDGKQEDAIAKGREGRM